MPKQRRSDPPAGDKPKRRSPRFKPLTLARRAINKAQRETKQYIPFTAFNRLVHDVIGDQASPVVRISKRGAEALWTEAEAMLVDVFRAAAGVTETCKRVKLTVRHLHNALRSAEIIGRTSYFRRVWARTEGAPAPHLEPAAEPEIVVVTTPAPLPPVVPQTPVVAKPRAKAAPAKSTKETAPKKKKKSKKVSSSSSSSSEESEPVKTKKAVKSKGKQKKKSHQCKYASVDPYGLKANTQRAIDRGRYGEPEFARRMLARGFKLPAYRAGSSSSSSATDDGEEDDEDDGEEELDADASQRSSLLSIARAQEQDFRRAIDEKAQLRYQNEVAAIRERSRQLAPIVKDVTYMVRSSLK